MEDNHIYAVVVKSLKESWHIVRVEVPFNEDEIQKGNKGHELFMERLYSEVMKHEHYDKISNGIDSYDALDITDLVKLEEAEYGKSGEHNGR